MNIDLWPRLGSATGMLFVLLFVIGFFGLGIAEAPEFGSSSAEEIGRFLEENRSRLFWHAALPTLGWALFVWFVSRLRLVLAAAEGGGGGWLSSVAFGSGLLVAGLFLAFHGLHAEFAAAHLSGGRAESILSRWTIIDASFALFGGTTFLRVSFIASTSLVAIRLGGLPKWMGWIGIGTALVSFVDGFGVLEALGLPLLDFALFLAWVFLASALLVAKSDGQAPEI